MTVMAISLIGCSKGAKQNVSLEGNKGEVTEIRLATWMVGEELEVFEQIATDFNAKNPDIEVTVMAIPNSEYDTKMTAMIAGNDVPEICFMESGTLLFPLAEQGIILNLQDYIDKDPEFDQDCLLENLTYKTDADFIAGYGAGAENFHMFYNPEIFRKYNVEEPPASYAEAWDWDTFVNVAQQLTIDSEGRNALDPEFDFENIETYGVNFAQWWPGYVPFLAGLGQDYLTEDGKSIGYATEEGVKVFQNLADLIHKYHVAPTPTAGAVMPGTSEALATNKVAMTIGGHWENMTLMEDEINYNVAALPKMGDKSKTIITAAAISLMNTEKADEAWEFMKYLLTEPGLNKPLYECAVWLPNNKIEYSEEVMKSFVTDKHPSNYVETCIKPMIDGTAMMPTTAIVKNFNKINDTITPALDELWSGEKTAQEVMDGIKDAANAEVQGFYGR